jgi:hypothetical protein
MNLKQPSIDPQQRDKALWLAGEIFRVFPESVTGLVIYVLYCGCVYYQRKFVDGQIDQKFGIYRDAEDGACEDCMFIDEDWKDRVVKETVVYNSKIQVVR